MNIELRRNKTIGNMEAMHHKKQQVSRICSLKSEKVIDFLSRGKTQRIMFQNGGNRENLYLNIGYRVHRDTGT